MRTSLEPEPSPPVDDAWVTLESSGAAPSPTHNNTDTSRCSSRSARDVEGEKVWEKQEPSLRQGVAGSRRARQQFQIGTGLHP
jgi:hypothetical protein